MKEGDVISKRIFPIMIKNRKQIYRKKDVFSYYIFLLQIY